MTTAALVLALGLAAPSPASAPPSPALGGELVEIQPGLRARSVDEDAFVVTHDYVFPANSVLVALGDRDLLLVDTPYTPAATRAVLEWARARFGARRVTAVNTHFHNDRLGGNQALRELGIDVHGSTRTVRLLAERGDAIRTLMAGIAKDPQIRAEILAARFVPPSHTFALETGLTLRLGGEEVRVLHPGAAHSPDNVVVFLPGRRLLVGGCLVQTGTRIGNKSDANLETWPDAIRALQALEPRWVVPGHGDGLSPSLLEHTLGLLSQERREAGDARPD